MYAWVNLNFKYTLGRSGVSRSTKKVLFWADIFGEDVFDKLPRKDGCSKCELMEMIEMDNCKAKGEIPNAKSLG